MKQANNTVGFYICMAIIVLFVACSKDTLFDVNGHAFSHPFAFVSHTAHNSPLLSDSTGLEIIDTVPKDMDVYFIGLVSPFPTKGKFILEFW